MIRVKVKGEWSDLQANTGSHYGIELLPKPKSVAELKKKKTKDGGKGSVKSCNAEGEDSNQFGDMKNDENVGDSNQDDENNSDRGSNTEDEK